jgi:hypothetical protein
MPRNDRLTAQAQSDTLAELARRVEWLRPGHRDPHKFHEEKSEIAYELSQLAGRIV